MVIQLLTQRCATLRRGVAALKAENAEPRLELDQVGRRRTPSAWPSWRVDALESWEVALPPGAKAPAATRIALLEWLEGRVPSRVLDDVQLLASELVTNGVLHADVGPGTDMVHVGVELASDALRLRVEDAGATGAIARRTPDVAAGTGYGLNIVAALASEWGISRTDSTRVWAELTWLS